MAQIILDSNNNLIQGDFDNATLNNRTKLQTTTTNATTNVYVVPNGSSTSAGVSVANNSSLTNASKIVMATNGTTDTQIISGVNGSGTYLPLSFYTNNTLAGQFDTSGNFGVGTVSPSVKFQVAGGSASTNSVMKIHNVANSNTNTGCAIQFSNDNTSYFMGQIATLRTDSNVYYSSYMTFSYTNNTTLTEGMRLDSSGRLLVGTTSSSNVDAKFAVVNAGSGSILMQIQRGGENPAYIGSDNSNIFSIYDSGTTQRFRVTSAGSCQNTTGSYGSISDVKLKENIVDATPKLEKVMQLQVKNFNLKTDPDLKQIGFIAQELQQVFPSLVEQSEDEDENGEKTGEITLGVKTTVLIPILVKAIQEQQTIINELKTRIEALENK